MENKKTIYRYGTEERGWGEWLLDTTYPGKSKEIYRCSLCDHWESAKKGGDKMLYMRFCPRCGARMNLPEGFAESRRSGTQSGDGGVGLEVRSTDCDDGGGGTDA